jgi:hypothetical protein
MRLLVLPIILALSIAAATQSPAVVESQILGYLKTISRYGTYSGNYTEDKLNKANDALRATLIRNGKRRDIMAYSFPKLKDEMYVVTSRDGKLRIYSWDLQTGGTMHDFDNVYQFQGATGAVLSRTAARDDESAGGFYTQIFQLNSKGGPIYLVNSTFIAQGRTHGQSIEVVRIRGDRLDNSSKLIRTASGLTNSIDFVYDPASIPESYTSGELVSFDSTKRSFSFPVIIEDKETFDGRVTKNRITYRFNGEYFVKAGQ